ncbi:MAG TPA: TIGR03435 family protein [Bryobacteraceae bacterium]|nr:TIGR03435 family protein [Bryobacteraceae bacterium]
MPRHIGVIALALSLATVGCGQSFEAASVRLNKNPHTRGNMEFLPGGERFIATNVWLGALVETAYDVTNQQCDCLSARFPVLTQSFDVVAKADHPVTPSQMLRMMQNLLAERFQLVVRYETKEVPAYALVPDKSGPKLRASSAVGANELAPRNPYHARGTESRTGSSLNLSFANVTMADLAWRLSTLADVEDRAVIDQTDLNGHYDIELKIGTRSTTELSADAGPSLFTALREQLGLRLEPRRMPLQILRIEHAQRPTDN